MTTIPLGISPRLGRQDYLLVLGHGFAHNLDMAEIVQFVHNGASRVSPQVLKGVHRKLPFLKVEFATINAPKFPHLVDQLEFLADLVEDFVDGEADEVPYMTIAAAAFALIYAHRQLDLIPNSVPDLGHADDSGVVRAVLMEHERVLSDYAAKHHINWERVTVNA